MSDASLDKHIQSSARTYAIVGLVVTLLLALNLLRLLGLIPFLSAVWNGLFAGDLRAVIHALGDLASRLIPILPAIFYLGGAWAAREMFDQISEGDMLTRANAKSLRKIGASLFSGALAAALFVPMLTLWVEGGHGGFSLRPEPQTLVIGFVGLALTMLGDLMLKAAGVSAERDSLKAEMHEFV